MEGRRLQQHTTADFSSSQRRREGGVKVWSKLYAFRSKILDAGRNKILNEGHSLTPPAPDAQQRHNRMEWKGQDGEAALARTEATRGAKMLGVEGRGWKGAWEGGTSCPADGRRQTQRARVRVRCW